MNLAPGNTPTDDGGGGAGGSASTKTVCDVGPAPGRLRGRREPHLPARAVAQVADGVDRLVRRPRGDEHPHTAQVLPGSEHRARGVEDDLGLGHAPDTGIARGQRALVGSHDHRAAVSQQLDVRPGRGVTPHPRVQRRSEHDRTRRLEERRGEQVVRQPEREAREQVRGGWRDDGELRAASEPDVQDGIGLLEHVAVHGLAREGREGRRTDEPRRGRRHHGLDVGASVDQQAKERDRLVRSDAARNPEEDAAPRERGHGSA